MSIQIMAVLTDSAVTYPGIKIMVSPGWKMGEDRRERKASNFRTGAMRSSYTASNSVATNSATNAFIVSSSRALARNGNNRTTAYYTG